MKRYLLIITLIALALVSCKTQKPTSTLMPPVVINNTDTVIIESTIETTYKPVDVSIELPEQSVYNVTPTDSSHVETDLAFSDAWFADGILHHLIKNKSGQLHGQVLTPSTIERKNTEATKVREIPVPQPYPVEVERELTLLEQIKLASFWYLVVAIILTIGYIFRRPLLKALRKILR